MTKLFSTGEFAKLCGVKKDTVLYYDKIGLLKPAFVNEKGYRFYSFDDFLFMGWLKMMRSHNVSLDDIMSCTENADEEKLQSLFAKNRESIIGQRDYLDFIIKCSDIRLNRMEIIKNMKYKECRIFQCSEEYYIASEQYCINKKPDESKLYYDLAAFNEHLEYMEENGIPNSFMNGALIDCPAYIRGEKCSQMLTTVVDRIDCDRLLVKPAGRYLSVLNKEPYGLILDMRKLLSDYADLHGLKLADEWYVWELTEYYVTCDVEENLFLYQVHIIE